mmetsp:Transcript_46400/g.131219  ORF Transcript_46400/g.131219 Transcript_46400/m.131219 type:complete len:358 (+) Transcript_46400:55-1128(+)|eukprot:CAMPEP_0179287534 /NCGR_PEP_ID=MMETSP0797-20121207/40316_1 /TAXON_ID=47934 /ORGANISM="Dinophysis acuminata, Strain DAEP01" /LENGTH=357 /DNA_ID=CAMNT_0020996471 /DNA_START=55 /DNA_END=1128 /DNA_ORIENTATION=+
MVTPDIFTTVGFERRKFGASGKELGYLIAKPQLSKLTAVVIAPILVLGLFVAWTEFEINVERRSHQRDMRSTEHRTAAKLAEIEMELWSHYREDIRESHEAQTLLRNLNASYDDFKFQLQGTMLRAAKDLGLTSDEASLLTETALQIVADHRHRNMRQTRDLVDHLVSVGQKGSRLQQHLDDEVARDMREETRHIVEHDEDMDWRGSPEDVKLSAIVNGFFETYREYLSDFSIAIHSLHEGSDVYVQLMDMHARAEEGREDGIEPFLDSLHRQQVIPRFTRGANTFMRTLSEFLGVLLMTPRVPHEQLSALEEEWDANTRDPYSVLTQLHEWEVEGRVPGYWLERTMATFEEGELQG